MTFETFFYLWKIFNFVFIFSNYAKLLSSQGNLQTAMMYLSTVNHEVW